MTDRPIIFSAPMVRALLGGTKTQTRRLLKGEPEPIEGIASEEQESHELENRLFGDEGAWIITAKPVPFVVGDRLWVKETHYLTDDGHEEYAVCACDEADVAEHMAKIAAFPFDFSPTLLARHRKLRSPIHMPRWASRLTLSVTDVRVERLQKISPEDAWQEGVNRQSSKVRQFWLFGADETQREQIYKRAAVWEYEDLWNSLHGPDAWAANPWVAAISFTVEQRNIGALQKAA